MAERLHSELAREALTGFGELVIPAPGQPWQLGTPFELPVVAAGLPVPPKLANRVAAALCAEQMPARRPVPEDGVGWEAAAAHGLVLLGLLPDWSGAEVTTLALAVAKVHHYLVAERGAPD